MSKTVSLQELDVLDSLIYQCRKLPRKYGWAVRQGNKRLADRTADEINISNDALMDYMRELVER